MVHVEERKWCGGSCGRYLPVASFSADESRADGLSFYCRICARKKKRDWVSANRSLLSARQRLRHERERAADEVHAPLLEGGTARWMGEGGGHREVPRGPVIRWVEEFEEHLPEDDRTEQNIARALGTNARFLYALRVAERPTVSFDIAEQIAIRTGNVDEFWDIVPEPGEEGWGPDGRLCCDRCGAWWRKHHARGMCDRCYGAWHFRRAHGIAETLPPGSWSRYHSACLSCGETARKHSAQGLCTSCWSRANGRSRVLGRSIVELLAEPSGLELVRMSKWEFLDVAEQLGEL
jgi:hypothetical protein